MSPVFDTPLITNDLSLDRLLAVRLPIMLVFMDTKDQQSIQQELKHLADKYAGQLLIAKIVTKENPKSKERYNIRQTPAVVGLKDGEAISTAEGISSSSLPEYARYLTGRGPKPTTPDNSNSPPEGHPSKFNGRDNEEKPVNTEPITVSDYSFDREVMQSPMPVLVDFWAPWCGPCRMTEPILNKLAQEMHDRLAIAKVNVDENPQLSNRFGIQSIPTMMVIKNGNVIDRWMGALPEPALRNRLSRVIH